jgi:hypothetical protein
MLITTLLALGLGAQAGVQIEAQLGPDALEVGGTYNILVSVTFDEGVTASKAGAPALFLQLDVPPSVQLTGPYYETHRDLARNEFLQMPFERLLEEDVTKVPFELALEPTEGEFIALNVVGYVRSVEKPKGYFLRRRLRLDLKAGAQSTAATGKRRSGWGLDTDALQIGDKASAFKLPKVDGSGLIDLSEHLGKRNVIVTTYRAFW